jgi:hypothetical protein
MSLRIVGCALLLILLAALQLPAFQTRQDAPPTANAPAWEYKVQTLEWSRCVYDQSIVETLNTAGREGWELVRFERPEAPAFPKEAEGTLLLKPAATGPGRNNTPQTVDSFQGTITLKMGQTQPQPHLLPGCRLVFKRQLRSPAKP